MVEEGMEETKLSGNNEKIEREAPQLVTVLKDIKGGLDDLRTKVQVLTSQVKSGGYPRGDGMSYLEAKHLLLLNYCQSLVYYLLRKAKGLSVQGHPLVHSLIDTRLFLEKIRPIDKKLQYQIGKLTKRPTTTVIPGDDDDVVNNDKKVKPVEPADADSLKLRPNPDMLTDKLALEDGDGLYRPPKIAPTSMKTSKEERNVSRKEKQVLRQALQSDYARDLFNDLEGRPQEVREVIGTEDRDVVRYRAKMEDRARREEDLFTRAPLTRMEKKTLKHMRSSRNGLDGLADNFFDDIKSLPLEEGQTTASDGHTGERSKFKKHKRRH